MTNPKLIATPFAENGDKNSIPETNTDPSNPQLASMSVGFPPITQQKISEGGIPPERDDFNGMFNLVTQHLVHLNNGMSYEFDQEHANKIGGYPLNTRLMLNNGDIVQSTIANNVNNPNINMVGWTNPKEEQKNINDTLQAEVMYSTYPFSTIQNAVDNSSSGNSIYMELKQYNESVDLNKNNLIGRGYGTVINIDPSGYGIKSLETQPNWDKTKLADIAFKGIEKNNNVGLLFDPSNPVAGRRNVEYCTFENLDIAIKKPAGNIGNSYRAINAHDCNYVIKANSVWTPLEMHSGNDTWSDFQVDNISIWAFDYVDLTGGGAIHLKDGIIEYCEGGGIRIEYSNSLPPFIPPKISNVWFEAIATASTVNRDGVNEVPRTIKLVNTAMCIIDNCKLNNIELVNSTALAINCRMDSNSVYLDGTSNLIVQNAYLNGSVNNKITISSIAKQNYPSSMGGNLVLRGNEVIGTERTPSSSSAAVGVTYIGNIGKQWAVDGTALIYATSILDSNGSSCAQLNLTASTVNVLPYVTIPQDHWVVFGISVKQVGDISGQFKFNFDYNLGDIILEKDKWVHSFGIAKSPSAAMRMRANFSPTTNGTLLIKNYFIVSFEKESDALAFANARVSVDTYPNIIQVDYDPPSIPANSTTTINVDFLGASLGDNVVCSFNRPLLGVRIFSEVTAQNVVTVSLLNSTSSPIDLLSGKLTVRLVQN